MKRKTQQFPQISRSFPALARRSLGGGGSILYIIVLKTVVLSLLAFLLATSFLLPPSGFESAKLGVLLSPNDLSSHLLLVQAYLGQGNMPAVERELTLAESLSRRPASPPASLREALRAGSFSLSISSVLGASLSPIKIWEKIRNEPQRINDEISFWEKVVADKPNYRDAYLQLALLNYQIYETQKAKVYLEKAKVLDPNFETTKELEKLLKTF